MRFSWVVPQVILHFRNHVIGNVFDMTVHGTSSVISSFAVKLAFFRGTTTTSNEVVIASETTSVS